MFQFFRCGLAKEIGFAALSGFAVGIAALLCLKHKAAAFIGVQPSKAFGAIAIVLKHAAFENIIIVRIIGLAALGRINANQRGKAVHKALRIGKFRTAGNGPFGDEGFDLIVSWHLLSLDAECHYSQPTNEMAISLQGERRFASSFAVMV